MGGSSSSSISAGKCRKEKKKLEKGSKTVEGKTKCRTLNSLLNARLPSLWLSRSAGEITCCVHRFIVYVPDIKSRTTSVRPVYQPGRELERLYAGWKHLKNKNKKNAWTVYYFQANRITRGSSHAYRPCVKY